MREIDLESWERKSLYEGYMGFDRGCFNITVKIPAQETYDYCKSHGISFFLASLYGIARTANEVENFKYRELSEGHVAIMDPVNIVTPIDIGNDLFKEMEMRYYPEFGQFVEEANKVIASAKGRTDASMGDCDEYSMIVSCVPWIHFEALTLPDYTFRQSTPIITYGRLKDGEIPVNIRAHHAFIDGKHVSHFVDLLGKIWGESCGIFEFLNS